jgi:hypothetical protein
MGGQAAERQVAFDAIVVHVMLLVGDEGSAGGTFEEPDLDAMVVEATGERQVTAKGMIPPQGLEIIALPLSIIHDQLLLRGVGNLQVRAADETEHWQAIVGGELDRAVAQEEERVTVVMEVVEGWRIDDAPGVCEVGEEDPAERPCGAPGLDGPAADVGGAYGGADIHMGEEVRARLGDDVHDPRGAIAVRRSVCDTTTWAALAAGASGRAAVTVMGGNTVRAGASAVRVKSRTMVSPDRTATLTGPAVRSPTPAERVYSPNSRSGKA